MRNRSTLVLAVFASLAVPLAAASQHKTKTAKPAGGNVAKGKEIAKKCGCHGPELKGTPGGAPNIRATGELKDYNQKTFERSMDQGVNERGRKFKPPMPTFHMAKADADALWAYLQTLK